jgi:hypothetical protein
MWSALSEILGVVLDYNVLGRLIFIDVWAGFCTLPKDSFKDIQQKCKEAYRRLEWLN